MHLGLQHPNKVNIITGVILYVRSERLTDKTLVYVPRSCKRHNQVSDASLQALKSSRPPWTEEPSYTQIYLKTHLMLLIYLIREASLVAQWLRICLPMQGTWVRALVWEDPTCHGATGPVSHNY